MLGTRHRQICKTPSETMTVRYFAVVGSRTACRIGKKFHVGTHCKRKSSQNRQRFCTLRQKSCQSRRQLGTSQQARPRDCGASAVRMSTFCTLRKGAIKNEQNSTLRGKRAHRTIYGGSAIRTPNWENTPRGSVLRAKLVPKTTTTPYYT